MSLELTYMGQRVLLSPKEKLPQIVYVKYDFTNDETYTEKNNEDSENKKKATMAEKRQAFYEARIASIQKSLGTS
jgi:hypothetical protein